MTSSTFTQQSANKGQTGFAQTSVTRDQVDHYLAQARKMRAEMFSQLVRGAYTRLFHAGKIQPAQSVHETHRGATHAA